MPKDALALAHSQRHPIAQAQMRGEQRAVPQMTSMTELLGLASQVTSQCCPLLGVQRGWPTRPCSVTQASQSMSFKACHPALHRP